eukprot:365303-Chlamydomonas_euryale.AAC.42
MDCMNLIINVGDTDLRVMNYDYRISNIPGSYYHWHFVNANSCCNNDPVVDFGSCYSNSYIPNARQQAFPREIPECPPSVVFQCYELSSRFCNQVRIGDCQQIYFRMPPAFKQPLSCECSLSAYNL